MIPSYPLATAAARKLAPASGGIKRADWDSWGAAPMTRLVVDKRLQWVRDCSGSEEKPFGVEFAAHCFYTDPRETSSVSITLTKPASRNADGVNSVRILCESPDSAGCVCAREPDQPVPIDETDDSNVLMRHSDAGTCPNWSDVPAWLPYRPPGCHCPEDSLLAPWMDVDITSGAKTVRLDLRYHAPFAIQESARAKEECKAEVTLARLRLVAIKDRLPIGRRPASIGRHNTSYVLNARRATRGQSWLLDLPSHVLEQIIARFLTDQVTWGPLALTCRSLYEFVGSEDFFRVRYRSVWPWASRLRLLPDHLPCHLLPLQDGEDDGVLSSEQPMRAAYVHARQRDISNGKEMFPMAALGWTAVQRNRRPSAKERATGYIIESDYDWIPYGETVAAAASKRTDRAASKHCGLSRSRLADLTKLIALPLPFEYVKPTEETSALDRISRDIGDQQHPTSDVRSLQIAISRMRALNTANMLPPLLHLTHYIPRDTAEQYGEPTRLPGRKFRCRQRVGQLWHDSMHKCGQPCGWGIVVDVHVAPGEVIGEYVGELVRADDAESASSSDDDCLDSDDEEMADEQWEAFRVHAVRRMQLIQRRMYKMRLREGHSIQPHLRGNWTRFVNHSTSPNVRYEEWLLPTGDAGAPFKPRVAIISTRAITPGEELFADYNAFHSDEWTPPDDKHNNTRCGPCTNDGSSRARYSDELGEAALGTPVVDVAASASYVPQDDWRRLGRWLFNE